ncbi:DUF4025 domain-containing protein [Niallia nealsonii]|uniref:DUF4025 domain-containing protein n=1 Tax=Niallia nealsonii TaxID=115979 RepID=A0A2N0Z514_9BACI|nr:DUF4025 domain-containing protein [Niallia nealsonii]
MTLTKNTTDSPAGKTYSAKDKHEQEHGDEVLKGLSETHEQATDTLTEGTIDQKKDKE